MKHSGKVDRYAMARLAECSAQIGSSCFFEGLSARARHILTALGAENPESVLKLTQEQLVNARSCGKRTTAEIEAFQETLRDSHTCSASATAQPASFFEHAPSEVFAAVKAVLSARANHALENMQVGTLKEFMLLATESMIECRNCGCKTVKEIQNIQSKMQACGAQLADGSNTFDPGDLLPKPGLLRLPVSHHVAQASDDFLADTEQPAAWLRRWLQSLGCPKRSVLAFMLRKGMLGHAPMTLEAVGQHIGVTRERVRQIEIKVEKYAKAPRQQQRLRPLIETAAGIVQQHGGTLNIKELTVALLCRGDEADQMRFASGLLEFIATLSEWKKAGLRLGQDGVVRHGSRRRSRHVQ